MLRFALVCFLLFLFVQVEAERKKIRIKRDERCPEGFTGLDCKVVDKKLVYDTQISDSVDRRIWKYYHVNVEARTPQLSIVANLEGDCDVYLRLNDYPNKYNYTLNDISLGNQTVFVVQNPQEGVWYAGVYGFQPCSFTIKASKNDLGVNCNGHGKCVGNGTCECICDPPYYGATCEKFPSLLDDGVTQEDSVLQDEWIFYTYPVYKLKVVNISVVQQKAGGDCDLYVRHGGFPSFSRFDVRDLSTAQSFNVQITSPKLGMYFIGVYGFQNTTFTITPRTTDICPNNCSLHGTCKDDGCDCEEQYSGYQCETRIPELSFGEEVNGLVMKNSWNYFSISCGADVENLVVQIQTDEAYKNSDEDCDLYVKQNTPPDLEAYTYRSIGSGSDENLVIPSATNAHWHIGIFGFHNCHFKLTVTSGATCPKNCNGKGTCVNGVCHCNNGYGGEDCGTDVISLGSYGRVNHPVSSSVEFNQWRYFSLTVPKGSVSSYLSVHVKEEPDSQELVRVLNLVLSKHSFPTLRNYDSRSVDHDDSPFHRVRLERKPNLNENRDEVYYIGVYGADNRQHKRNFQIQGWMAPI